jgi:hypothetical protein
VELSRATLDGGGPESGRVADFHGLGDETGIMLPPRMRTSSWDLGQPTLQPTGCLQSETAWDISARQSDGHFLVPINVPRQLSPEFLLVILLMSSDLRRIGTPFFLAFAKKLKRWIRESVTGSFWLRQILHAKKVSGDAAPCRARRLSLRPVLCIEAKQAAVESVAPAAPAAVHIFGERNGRNRSPIANLRWLS